MILKMLARTQIHRQNKKVKLSKALVLNSDKATYVRAKLNAEGQVTPLANQESLATISDADCLIALPEKSKKLSAGDDLVEPGSKLAKDDDEFESNSWFLTTFMREAGAHAFRVHTIPETAEQLKLVIEDQLVRSDLIVISGESKDESFDLITSVISQLGEIKIVTPNLNESGKHSYGLIGPDKTPVITLNDFKDVSKNSNSPAKQKSKIK